MSDMRMIRSTEIRAAVLELKLLCSASGPGFGIGVNVDKLRRAGFYFFNSVCSTFCISSHCPR